MDPTIKLGDRVEDPVSGFTGQANARCEYLHENNRIRVKSEALHDGKPIYVWFDEAELVLSEE